MIEIYHNPKCSKSREALEFLKNKGLELSIIHYLESPPNIDTLKKLIKKLQLNPIHLVRTKETIWQESYANKKLNDEEIIQALLKHPKLIERPIIIKGNKAVIARPIEKILEFL